MDNAPIPAMSSPKPPEYIEEEIFEIKNEKKFKINQDNEIYLLSISLTNQDSILFKVQLVKEFVDNYYEKNYKRESFIKINNIFAYPKNIDGILEYIIKNIEAKKKNLNIKLNGDGVILNFDVSTILGQEDNIQLKLDKIEKNLNKILNELNDKFINFKDNQNKLDDKVKDIKELLTKQMAIENELKKEVKEMQMIKEAQINIENSFKKSSEQISNISKKKEKIKVNSNNININSEKIKSIEEYQKEMKKILNKNVEEFSDVNKKIEKCNNLIQNTYKEIDKITKNQNQMKNTIDDNSIEINTIKLKQIKLQEEKNLIFKNNINELEYIKKENIELKKNIKILSEKLNEIEEKNKKDENLELKKNIEFLSERLNEIEIDNQKKENLESNFKALIERTEEIEDNIHKREEELSKEIKEIQMIKEAQINIENSFKKSSEQINNISKNQEKIKINSNNININSEKIKSIEEYQKEMKTKLKQNEDEFSKMNKNIETYQNLIKTKSKEIDKIAINQNKMKNTIDDCSIEINSIKLKQIKFQEEKKINFENSFNEIKIIKKENLEQKQKIDKLSKRLKEIEDINIKKEKENEDKEKEFKEIKKEISLIKDFISKEEERKVNQEEEEDEDEENLEEKEEKEQEPFEENLEEKEEQEPFEENLEEKEEKEQDPFMNIKKIDYRRDGIKTEKKKENKRTQKNLEIYNEENNNNYFNRTFSQRFFKPYNTEGNLNLDLKEFGNKEDNLYNEQEKLGKKGIEDDPFNLKYKKTITSDLFTKKFYNNRACIFICSKDEGIYIAYGVKSLDLECYDVNNNRIFIIQKKLHKESFDSCRYFYEELKRKDLIITSSLDGHVKVINFSKYDCFILLDLNFESNNQRKIINTVYYINQHLIVPISNFDNGIIRFYKIDYGFYDSAKSTFIGSINKDAGFILGLNHFCRNFINFNKSCLLVANTNGVFVYYIDNLKFPQLYHKFIPKLTREEEKNNGFEEAYVIEKDEKFILIGPCFYHGYLFFWDFITKDLLNIMKLDSGISDICLWDNNYIFASLNHSTSQFVLIDINNRNIEKIFEVNDKDPRGCGIKVIRDTLHGSFLISSSINGKLNLYSNTI